MALDQQKTIILLVAILLAVIATSVTVLLLIPKNGDDASPTDVVRTNTGTTQPTNFNTGVLERAAYRALDQRLIQENALPVQPPAAIGKANPFL